MKTIGQIATQLGNHIFKGREIRFPGGKSKDGNHACFGVIARNGIHGKEILVVPYDPQIDKYILDDEEYPEDKRGTLTRELLEETGIQPFQYELLAENPVRDTREGKTEYDKHIKYAWVITDYDASNIRTQPARSRRIYPPIWVPLTVLYEFLWDHHRWMLESFEEYSIQPFFYQPKIISFEKQGTAA